MVAGDERSGHPFQGVAGEDQDEQVSSLLGGLSLSQRQQQQRKEDGEGRALSALFVEGQALVEALEEDPGAEGRREKLERGMRLFTDLKVGRCVVCSGGDSMDWGPLW